MQRGIHVHKGKAYSVAVVLQTLFYQEYLQGARV